MEWYVEEETRALREALEREILSWSQVTHRKMMGCPCYMANGKMFAGLVTGGMVITKLTQDEREELGKIHPVKPFQAGSRTLKKWAHLILELEDLGKVMPYVRASYEAALKS